MGKKGRGKKTEEIEEIGDRSVIYVRREGEGGGKEEREGKKGNGEE